MDKFEVFLNQRSALKLAAIPAIIMAAYNWLGFFAPDVVQGIDPIVFKDSMDKAVNHILELIVLGGYLYGVFSNILKNGHLIKNGLSFDLTKLIQILSK